MTVVVEVSPYDSSEASRPAAENTKSSSAGDRLRIETPESGGRLFRRSGQVRVDISLPLDSQLQAQSARPTSTPRVASARRPSNLDRATLRGRDRGRPHREVRQRRRAGRARGRRAAGPERLRRRLGDVRVGSGGRRARQRRRRDRGRGRPGAGHRPPPATSRSAPRTAATSGSTRPRATSPSACPPGPGSGSTSARCPAPPAATSPSPPRRRTRRRRGSPRPAQPSAADDERRHQRAPDPFGRRVGCPARSADSHVQAGEGRERQVAHDHEDGPRRQEQAIVRAPIRGRGISLPQMCFTDQAR